MKLIVRLSWTLLTFLSFCLSMIIWNDLNNHGADHPFMVKFKEVSLPNFNREQFPKIDEFVWVDQVATPLNYFETRLKLKEFAFKETSFVMARILVDQNGNYVKHKIVETKFGFHGRLMDKYAKDMKFRPAYRNQKPVASWRNISFSF